MVRSMSFLGCVLFCASLAAAAEPEKVPDGASIEQAKKLVRDLYKAEFAKKKASEQLDLARRLLKDAEETKDPAGRFAMLREARDLAARGGDVFLGMDIANTTVLSFALNPVELRVDTLDAAEKAKIAPGRAVADSALDVLDEAIRADDYKSADRVLKIASSAASRAGVASVPAAVAARTKELDAIRKAYESLEATRKTLASNAEDPSANAKLGRFTCFLKGNWETGLAMLAKSDEELIKVAAALDLEKKLPSERGAVADRWFDVAEKVDPTERAEVRLRAYSAYIEASGESTGLDKTRIDKQIADLEKDPKIVRAKGNWTIVFRSADPTIWNTNVNKSRDHFAIPLDKVSSGIKYMKMSTTFKNTSVILEMSKDRIGKQSEQDGYGWNGRSARQSRSTTLGIYDPQWKDYPRGSIHVYRAGDWYRGWGFGSIYPNDDEQGFSWAGAPISKVVFEISVKSFSLTVDESKLLLK